MLRLAFLLSLIIVSTGLLAAAEETGIVFRSDVSLVRVDAQVLDRQNRAITGLQADDFVLFENGARQEIRHFAREEMPVDIVLLLDVSGSMRPHVERVASAADEALTVLGEGDRVAVMVFDRATRIRLPFNQNRNQVAHGLHALLRQETFDGGTDITRALFEAAEYISKEGRREARRAIVILTDDQTERDRDESGVGQALARADTVLSALLAPDAMHSASPRMGGGSWPGGGPMGGPMGGPLGGIIFGRRRFPSGGRFPDPTVTLPRTRSAGTAEIAQRSGGDSMRVDDASALQTTLARLRQRYALYFLLPEGVQPGQERAIEVALSDSARRRYQDSEVRYRRAYSSAGTVSTESRSRVPAAASQSPETVSQRKNERRRPAVNERSGDQPYIVSDNTGSAQQSQGGWRRSGETPATEASPAEQSTPSAEPEATKEPQPPRGWRRVKPGEQP